LGRHGDGLLRGRELVMGGREAIRGFAVQTIVCLFDSLSSEEEWTTVTLEPDSSNDKVDVYWEFADGSTCAQQVKSSINPIGKGHVKRWCSELKASGRYNKYQLILAGPIAAGALADAPFDGVEVPKPTSVDTLALVDQAITKVDRYLTSKSIAPVPLPLRESLIYELVARMTQAAIYGKTMSRAEFDGWVLSTITASYPEAVNQRLTSNCAVLWSALEFAAPPDASAKFFELHSHRGDVSPTCIAWQGGDALLPGAGGSDNAEPGSHHATTPWAAVR
jgi:hypothetical protein